MPIPYVPLPSFPHTPLTITQNQNDPIRKHTTLFRPFTSSSTSTSSETPSTTYETIHPLTPLETLEQFFDRQSLAASERNARRHAAQNASKETTPTPGSTFSASDSEKDKEKEGGEWDDEAEGRGHEFALVTDLGRKWVLAVATRNDLEVSLAFRCGHEMDG
jgi:hypothetical protein